MRTTTARADIAASPAMVWAALTDPARTSSYLGGLSITSAWRPDAEVEARHGDDLIAAGNVVVADEPSMLVYRLDDSQAGDVACWLAWELTQTGPGLTTVTLTADSLPVDPAVEVTDLLLRLKAYLESGSSDGRGGQDHAAPKGN